MIVGPGARAEEPSYDLGPPFGFDLLEPAETDASDQEKGERTYKSRHPYSICVSSPMGMHFTALDMSYCCILPPHVSIQAQIVQTGHGAERPRLLTPEDKVTLGYSIQDNSYSEGNKIKYWHALKDVSGDGSMISPNDNMAHYVWTHLFIYRDLEGTLPDDPQEPQRMHLGGEIPMVVDAGPFGKSISGGTMDYARENGGNIVFTDSMLPELKDIPLALTASHLWNALGLPLTPFNDTRRKGSIRSLSDTDFQPYQSALVQLCNERGEPLLGREKTVRFSGTLPADTFNCLFCHSASGVAAVASRAHGLEFFQREYAYWKQNHPDTSEYMARFFSANINILQLHDARHKTEFLKAYDPDAVLNRMGSGGPVYCADCHGENLVGNLRSPRSWTTGYRTVKAKPLSEAIHAPHMRFTPMPDRAGRTQSCQVCHPSHRQSETMNDFGANPLQVSDNQGNPRFSDGDQRMSGGGSFLRRDAHSNPDVTPPFFLNEIGKWFLNNVSMKDEKGAPVEKMRGLTCTNCHNHLSLELYRNDDLVDVVLQDGKTLRNRSLEEIVAALSEGDMKRFKSYFADPIAGAEGNPLQAYYAEHKSSVLLRTRALPDGGTELLPWNAEAGEAVTYASASAGSDWWLSPAEPHCADCHLAPFVESPGGRYFPMDQPNKYALYRHSKAHGLLACQTCHQSMHGLYPVRDEGPQRTVDGTTHEQALQFSPDGKYAGPLTCSACHTVNSRAVPVQLEGTEYSGDYWAAVVLIHFMREGDRNMGVQELTRKYPYAGSRGIVSRGWK
jgi:hypothetical protein